MDLPVSSVVEGKVTGITKFGAFVSMAGGRTGMVHISEIANTYVNDIREHLTEGQEVKVKVIGVDKEGRINLSIKKAMDPPPQPAGNRPAARPGAGNRRPSAGPLTFEDKLKQFIQSSDNKISNLPPVDRRNPSRRKGSGKGEGNYEDWEE